MAILFLKVLKNLRVVFDSCLKFQFNIKAIVVRPHFFILVILPKSDQSVCDAETEIRACVSPRLDYPNILYSGLVLLEVFSYSLDKEQKIGAYITHPGLSSLVS